MPFSSSFYFGAFSLFAFLSMKTKRKSVPLIDREHSNTTVSVSHQLTNVDESVSVTSVDFVVLGSCVVSVALVIYHLLVCFSFRYKLDTVTAGQNFTKIRKAITAGLCVKTHKKDTEL